MTSFDYYALISRMCVGTELFLNIGININAIILLLYPMYGYYFKNYIEKEKNNFKRDLFLLFIVFILLFVPHFKLLTNQIGHRVYYYPLGILLSLLTFNVVYNTKFPAIFERGIHFISANSLSYYFVHRFILYNLHDKLFFVNRPINTIVIFILAVVIVTILIFIFRIITDYFKKINLIPRKLEKN